jgi:hypothetical protein
VAAPKVWKKLPPIVPLSDTNQLFRSSLKHFYLQLHMKNFDNDPSQVPLLPHGFMALYKSICDFDLMYLGVRYMKIPVNGYSLKWADMISGVPQGPLLFLLFVNILPDCVQKDIRIIADDTQSGRKSGKQRIVVACRRI